MAFTPFVETDAPTMAAFNEKFAQAIAEAESGAINKGTKRAEGSYVGTGTATNKIELPFTPKAVYVCRPNGMTYFNLNGNVSYYGGLAVTGSPASGEGVDFVTITENGFVVVVNTTTHSSHKFYTNDTVAFNYIAIG